ncbi:hypothetical protein GOODEAATRI_020351, partial [Goodea atripinnis]
VAWCPTRTGLLATLTRDSNIIRLYDMQHTPTPIGDETEPTIIERSVQPCESQIGSFTWHPSSQNRMVVVSAANRVMTDFTVFERISLAWSSTASLMWACGRHLYNCVEDLAEGEDSAAEKDIATKMRERAQSRVNTKSAFLCKTFGFVFVNYNQVGKITEGKSRRCWSGSDRQTDVTHFHSEERCLALRLCGWISRGPDIDVETFLRSLEQEREWERAAAIALFNLDIRRAIQILNKGAVTEKGEW